MTLGGSNSDSVAQDQIRAFVERILRMREEARAINDDIREIYAEAKGNGFDKTVLGKLVLYVEKRGKDAAGVAEAEALFELYRGAFDGMTGTRVATHAHEAPRRTLSQMRGVFEGEPRKRVDLIQEPAHPPVAADQGEGSATPPAASLATTNIAPVAMGEADTSDLDLSADQSTAARKDVRQGKAGTEPIENPAPLTQQGFATPDNIGDDVGRPQSATLQSEMSAGSSSPGVDTLEPAGTQAPPVDTPTAADNARKIRPWCLRADDLTKCGGYGRTHCHTCLKAHADAENISA